MGVENQATKMSCGVRQDIYFSLVRLSVTGLAQLNVKDVCREALSETRHI